MSALKLGVYRWKAEQTLKTYILFFRENVKLISMCERLKSKTSNGFAFFALYFRYDNICKFIHAEVVFLF